MKPRKDIDRTMTIITIYSIKQTPFLDKYHVSTNDSLIKATPKCKSNNPAKLRGNMDSKEDTDKGEDGIINILTRKAIESPFHFPFPPILLYMILVEYVI